MTYLLVAIAGFGGGVVRGFVGFITHQYRFKDVSFQRNRFIGTTLLSGCVGILTALASAEVAINIFGIESLTPGLALIVGYAGGDFIDNIYELITKKVFVEQEETS